MSPWYKRTKFDVLMNQIKWSCILKDNLRVRANQVEKLLTKTDDEDTPFLNKYIIGY